MKTNTLVKCVLMLAAVVVLGMMVKRYNERKQVVVAAVEKVRYKRHFFLLQLML